MTGQAMIRARRVRSPTVSLGTDGPQTPAQPRPRRGGQASEALGGGAAESPALTPEQQALVDQRADERRPSPERSTGRPNPTARTPSQRTRTPSPGAPQSTPLQGGPSTLFSAIGGGQAQLAGGFFGRRRRRNVSGTLGG